MSILPAERWFFLHCASISFVSLPLAGLGAGSEIGAFVGCEQARLFE